MPINFRCPHCRHVLSAPDNLAGFAGECMLCRQPFIVPVQPTVVVGTGAAAAPGVLAAGQSGSPDAAALPIAESIRFAGAAKHDDRSQRGPSRHAKPFKFIEPLYRNFGAKHTVVLAFAAVSGFTFGIAYILALGLAGLASAFAGQPAHPAPWSLAAGAFALMAMCPLLFVFVAIGFAVVVISIALGRTWLGRGGSLRTDIFSAGALFWVVLAPLIIMISAASLSAAWGNALGLVLGVVAVILMFRVVFESLRDLAQVPPWQAAAAAIGVLVANFAVAALGLYVILPLCLAK